MQWNAGCDIKLDWALLRKQKEWLQSFKGNDYADGLIHLIDAIQDHAVANGEASEREVFGAMNGK